MIRELGESIDIGGQMGFIIPADLAITDDGQLLLRLHDGEGKSYELGTFENVEKTPDDGDDWSEAEWAEWVVKTSRLIDEQEL